MELLIIVPNMEKKLVAADVCVGGELCKNLLTKKLKTMSISFTKR